MEGTFKEPWANSQASSSHSSLARMHSITQSVLLDLEKATYSSGKEALQINPSRHTKARLDHCVVRRTCSILEAWTEKSSHGRMKEVNWSRNKTLPIYKLMHCSHQALLQWISMRKVRSY